MQRVPIATAGRLGELARLFLKLGTVAFGGPAAHIAMMEDEVVRRRQWLTREQFLDYVGATNMIPGPNSTELAIHIGYAQAGWAGLFVAGACFIIPAALIVGVIAWAYVRFSSLPAAEGALYGVKPVVIAVVLQALWGLGRTALKTRTLVVLALLATVAAVVRVNELAILFGAGAIMAFLQTLARWRDRADERAAATHALLVAWENHKCGELIRSTSAVGAAAVPIAIPFGLWPLFTVFLKIGAVLFGSGYVLIAFLRADLVERLGWLSERQLLDAVAVGQLTPGPVFTTATFIGYLLGGGAGALAATVGIFLPAFFFVALSGLVLPRIRRSPIARAVLDGVNVASLALMAVATWELGQAALVDPLTIGLAFLSAALLIRLRTSSAWLVLAGAAVGFAVRR